MAESNKKPRAERTKNNRELILEKASGFFRQPEVMSLFLCRLAARK